MVLIDSKELFKFAYQRAGWLPTYPPTSLSDISPRRRGDPPSVLSSISATAAGDTRDCKYPNWEVTYTEIERPIVQTNRHHHRSDYVTKSIPIWVSAFPHIYWLATATTTANTDTRLRCAAASDPAWTTPYTCLPYHNFPLIRLH